MESILLVLKAVALLGYLYMVAWVVFGAYFQHKQLYHRRLVKELQGEGEGEHATSP